MSTNGITADELISAIQGDAARGTKPTPFVSTIAKRLGCSRRHVYTLLKKFPTAQRALEDEREGMKDFTENKLFEQINEGNTTAIIFYLKCQAKDRGYVERHEFAGVSDAPLLIRMDV